MQDDGYLQLKDICKSFPGVRALSGASVSFAKGEVHALLGENGAGKSTLCKILSGAYQKDSGTICFDGREYEGFTPISSKECGIGIIYQELNLIPYLTVYENIFLGKEISRGLSLNKREMIRRTRELFEELGISIEPGARVGDLAVAHKQLVEIVKAISQDVKVLIMDEPTSPLMNHEVEMLFGLIARLKAQGVTIIYISHRIEELFVIADRVTVMRDGMTIKTLNTGETSREALISLMIGRTFVDTYPKRAGEPGAEVLRVEKLCTEKLKDISFSLRKGEVLGLAGLVGAGRTEVVRAVFGADKITSGSIKIHNQEKKIHSPMDAIGCKISLIPEDRKGQGVLLKMSVRENVAMVKAPQISRFFTISPRKERSVVQALVRSLSIKTPHMDQKAVFLSGGNQQKVALAKWLAVDSDIIIFDEPTRGIDVGAKQEFYGLINDLRNEGKAILMVSSELPELMGMSDRILVLYEGRITGQLEEPVRFTQSRILDLASGGV